MIFFFLVCFKIFKAEAYQKVLFIKTLSLRCMSGVRPRSAGSSHSHQLADALLEYHHLDTHTCTHTEVSEDNHHQAKLVLLLTQDHIRAWMVIELPAEKICFPSSSRTSEHLFLYPSLKGSLVRLLNPHHQESVESCTMILFF